LQDLPGIPCVVATPAIGISTPVAFAAWDKKFGERSELTAHTPSDRINKFSHSVYEWLGGSSCSATGVPDKSWDRAEALLLDLVRAGIENDFESVVFSLYPAVREVKRVLERSSARYSSLSGSGSTVYGLFATREAAAEAAAALN